MSVEQVNHVFNACDVRRGCPGAFNMDHKCHPCRTSRKFHDGSFRIELPTADAPEDPSRALMLALRLTSGERQVKLDGRPGHRD